MIQRRAGGRSMDYIHYSTEEIFMAHGDDETEVESGILWETGLGGTSIMKTLKRDNFSRWISDSPERVIGVSGE